MTTDFDKEISEVIQFIHAMAESELDPRKHHAAFYILEDLLLELRSIAVEAGRQNLVETADSALAGLSKTLDEGCPFTDWLK
jgi:hypothetical protein